MEEKKKNIVMVVEDEKMLVDAITKKLELEGDTPLPFRSGKEAFEALEKTAILPDVIWLDYYLGDMNGREFVEKLKNNKRWAGIPVMVVSNSASEDKIKEMMDMGVYVYLLKADYKLEEITKLMRMEVLGRRV